MPNPYHTDLVLDSEVCPSAFDVLNDETEEPTDDNLTANK